MVFVHVVGEQFTTAFHRSGGGRIRFGAACECILERVQSRKIRKKYVVDGTLTLKRPGNEVG